uniref:Uncharacterized protein n=1 Tax=Anguilla anguilla TaxID=7936 RepID=A0A0E9PHV9_ANGAN
MIFRVYVCCTVDRFGSLRRVSACATYLTLSEGVRASSNIHKGRSSTTGREYNRTDLFKNNLFLEGCHGITVF